MSILYIGMMESLHNELRALKSAVVSTTVCPYFIETNPEISKHLELRYTLNINACIILCNIKSRIILYTNR